jgi:predicted dehydrogenase
MDKIRAAVIGCGAVARVHHLPAIKMSDQIHTTVLVDKVLSQAKELAAKFDVQDTCEEYTDIIGKVDAAIITLPNFLHAPVATTLLKNGIHVLVEKPMALNTQECDQMIEAARLGGAVLAVGLDYRFFRSSLFVKNVIDNGLLGNIQNIDLRQGVILRWPFTSDYLLRKEKAGGGVLMDFGAHLLDFVLWWFGDYESVDYYDDAVGGVEAECEVHLRLKCGASAIVELSRTRNLRNTCIIQGERGVLEVGIWDFNPPISLKVNTSGTVFEGRITHNGATDRNLRDVFRRQVDDFTDAISHGRAPFVSGADGRQVLKLIDACYATRRELSLPWSPRKMSLSA